MLETEIEAFLHQYYEETFGKRLNLIQNLQIKKNELEKLADEKEKITKEKEEFEKENNIQELNQEEEIEKPDETQIKGEIERLENEIKVLNEEKSQIKNNIEIFENKIDENEYLETDIENTEEEVVTLEEKVDVLTKTKDLLEKAKEKFSSQYLQTMIDGFKEYLNLIDDKDLQASVDINLGVNIEANGKKRDIKTFSTGYKDLVYICMRFSLIKALFEDELPFVILDDPLVNLDNSKTEKAKELIKQLANEYQIIYLVCNDSRR